MRKRYIIVLCMLFLCLEMSAQSDRHDVRSGNRKFRQEAYREAEVDYRKAQLRDSLSVAAAYNLASALYRQDDFDGAGKALEPVKEYVGDNADYHYNAGDIALQKKDYAAAVEAFKQSLLLNPGDLDAKENYIYARKMLENQQNGGGQDQNDQNQDNQDQNNQDENDQNQDNQDQNNQGQNNQDQNNQDQNNQDNQDQNNQNQDKQDQESAISPQQAQQMLQAIQAREKETQDKVNKEKALILKSRQKEKNW